MINQLDEMIRHLLDVSLNAPALPWTIDVGIRPPDDAWRSTVNANGRPAVSVYLVETREARDRRTSDAVLRRRPQPFQVDCHYVITAWIPTSDPTFGTPTIVEDWLLGQVISILSDRLPLNATDIYGGTPPPDLEPILDDLDLPTELLPPEGYQRLADFWTGVGQGNVWHPSAHLVVTLPIVRSDRPVGPPVTTLHVSTTPTITSTGAPPELVLDTSVDIGGEVHDGAGEPVRGAWVLLTDTAGTTTYQSATADADGRFHLVGLAPGDYRLVAGSTDHPAVEQPIEVPSNIDNYDLTLT